VRLAAALAGAACLLLAPTPACAAEGAAAAGARALLQRAFDRTLHAPGVRSVELRVHRSGRLVSRRAFDLAYRRDERGAQALLRFTAPGYLRGHALLVLETSAGTSDTWLYQAEERRPRRVTTAQKADSFYGSDLSFEDLEHQRFARWAVRGLPDAACGGAACAVIEALPPPGSQYGRLLVWVDRGAEGVARVDFFRGGEAVPSKRLLATLTGVGEETGHLRIRHLRIEQVGRDAWTDVETSRMVVDASIPAELFSAASLERESDDLYALALRRDGAP
jgi:hypothetical protein